MKQFMKQTSKFLMLALGMFILGCSSDDNGGDTDIPAVVAGFTTSINAVTGTATFTNTSTNANTYAWNFGDGNTSTETNPVKVYEDGTYTVSLKASNNAGASASFEDEITVTITDSGDGDGGDGDGGDGDGDTGCTGTEETVQSLSAADLNVTFQTDPGASIGSFDANLTWINNPDTDNEVNSSCKVGQIDRDGGALFANNQIELDAKLDLTASAGFKMKVWSPVAGTNVLVKLEDQADAGSFAEVSVATTMAGAWEELTFPFASSDTGKFDLIIIFFELNTDTTETYYIDDFALYACTVDCDGDDNGGGGPGDGTEGDLTVNGSFETGNDNGWTPFLNGGTFMVTDTEAACGDFSGNLEAGEGQSPLIKQSAIGIGTVTPNTEITISFDLRGSVDGEGGVVFAELFSETTGAGPSKAEILNNTQPLFPTDTWTRYTFTTTTGPDVTGGITLQLAAICGANAGCNVDAYFDNVFVSLGATGGVNCGNTEPGNGGDGGTGVGADFTTNGDFETGDLSSWTLFVDPAGASFTASSAQASDGTFSGNLISDFDAGNGAAVDAVVKQANLGVGTVTPNTDYVVSFDLRGSLTGIGGVFFAEFFSELEAGGTSKAEILSGAPLPLTDTWSNYNFTVTTGDDVSGGITLQMKTSSGTSAGTIVNAYFDNVSVKLAE
jgi:hypothetical protein